MVVEEQLEHTAEHTQLDAAADSYDPKAPRTWNVENPVFSVLVLKLWEACPLTSKSCCALQRWEEASNSLSKLSEVPL